MGICGIYFQMPWIAQCQQLKLLFKLRGSLISFYLCGNTGFAKDYKLEIGGVRHNIEEVPGVESVEKCQGLCNANPDCKIFTHYSSKTCELKGDLRNRYYVKVIFIITYL